MRIPAPASILIVAVLMAACAPVPSQPAAGGGAAGSTPPAASAAAPAAAPSPSPSVGAAERVDGVVQAVTGSQVLLSNQRSLTLTPSTRILRALPITPGDLHPGQYVAITAKRQPDNTLLASIVNIFPPSLGQVAPGQRPLPEGNLMTNATIEQVEGTSFTVVFPGGGARVQLAPDAALFQLQDADLSALQAGVAISAQVVNGEARSLTVQAGSPRPPAAPPTASPVVPY